MAYIPCGAPLNVDAVSAGFPFIYDASAKRVYFICGDSAFLQLLPVASGVIFVFKSDVIEGDRLGGEKIPNVTFSWLQSLIRRERKYERRGIK